MKPRLPEDELALAPGQPPDLDAKLVAALERIGQALRVQMWDTAKQHGITPTQLHVLLRLSSDPPERRRIGALAAELDVTHPTVSDAVTVLRRKRLVEREGTGRRATLALTGRGRALAEQVSEWHAQTRDQLAPLAGADKEATLRLLLDLIASLQRAGVISVARMCATCRFFRPHRHPGRPRPHHCALVDLPMADSELRVDCAEHEPAAAGAAITSPSA